MQTTLSPREMEMVELTAFGLAQKEIASKLRISDHTVDVTIRKAKEKLHIQKSTELAAWYFIKKYALQIDLPQVKRSMISLSFLSVMLFSIFMHYEPERARRAPRAQKAANTRTMSRTRRGDTGEDYQLTTI